MCALLRHFMIHTLRSNWGHFPIDSQPSHPNIPLFTCYAPLIPKYVSHLTSSSHSDNHSGLSSDFPVPRVVEHWKVETSVGGGIGMCPFWRVRYPAAINFQECLSSHHCTGCLMSSGTWVDFTLHVPSLHKLRAPQIWVNPTQAREEMRHPVCGLITRWIQKMFCSLCLDISWGQQRSALNTRRANKMSQKCEAWGEYRATKRAFLWQPLT